MCPGGSGNAMMRAMVEAYLSRAHLDNTEEHCALFALPSDVARASQTVREAYQNVLVAMAQLFERGFGEDTEARRKALTLASLCVGAMTLSSTVSDSALAEDIRTAALASACELMPEERAVAVRKVGVA